MEHESQHEEPPTPEPEAEVPRVWAGSLVDYNNGILHGDWIDVDGDEAELTQEVQAMLAASPTARATGEPAEEWGIFDYENFGPLQLSEYEGLDRVASLATGIREHGLAFAAWAAERPDQVTEAAFETHYIGDYESVEAYAAELVADLGAGEALARFPEWLQPYVHLDLGGLARDLQLSGQIAAVVHASGVWLFVPD